MRARSGLTLSRSAAFGPRATSGSAHCERRRTETLTRRATSPDTSSTSRPDGRLEEVERRLDADDVLSIRAVHVRADAGQLGARPPQLGTGEALEESEARPAVGGEKRELAVTGEVDGAEIRRPGDRRPRARVLRLEAGRLVRDVGLVFRPRVGAREREQAVGGRLERDEDAPGAEVRREHLLVRKGARRGDGQVEAEAEVREERRFARAVLADHGRAAGGEPLVEAIEIAPYDAHADEAGE
jgi:hypothetical protein